jgi:hypothetical protein
MRRVLLCLVIAAMLSGCAGMLGIQPAHYAVLVDNGTASEITFAAGADDSITVNGTVGPSQSGSILQRIGTPVDDDPIFYGSLCTKVDLVAFAGGREVARHPPGLCLNSTWEIGSPAPSQ